jgi:hypothetical protein
MMSQQQQDDDDDDAIITWLCIMPGLIFQGFVHVVCCVLEAIWRWVSCGGGGD